MLIFCAFSCYTAMYFIYMFIYIDFLSVIIRSSQERDYKITIKNLGGLFICGCIDLGGEYQGTSTPSLI